MIDPLPDFPSTLLSSLGAEDWSSIEDQWFVLGTAIFVRKLGRRGWVVEFRAERQFQLPTVYPRKRDAVAFAERVLRSESHLRGSR